MVVGACVGQVLTVLGHTVGVTQPALPPERCDVRVSPDVVCCTQLPLGRTVHQVQRATLYKWKFLKCKKKWDKKKSAWKTDVDLYLLSKTYRYFDKKGYNFVPIYNNHPKLLIKFWLKKCKQYTRHYDICGYTCINHTYPESEELCWLWPKSPGCLCSFGNQPLQTQPTYIKINQYNVFLPET